MPTLLIIFEMRFFFYSDEHEPIHVHVYCNGKRVQIALVPNVEVVYNHGLKEQEINNAVEICQLYREEFIEEWLKRFDS